VYVLLPHHENMVRPPTSGQPACQSLYAPIRHGPVIAEVIVDERNEELPVRQRRASRVDSPNPLGTVTTLPGVARVVGDFELFSGFVEEGLNHRVLHGHFDHPRSGCVCGEEDRVAREQLRADPGGWLTFGFVSLPILLAVLLGAVVDSSALGASSGTGSATDEADVLGNARVIQVVVGSHPCQTLRR